MKKGIGGLAVAISLKKGEFLTFAGTGNFRPFLYFFRSDNYEQIN
jgi:hypothetical protein